MVFRTPMFPLRTPPNVRKTAACTKDLEKPNPTQEIQVPSKPTSSTFFRPPQSASAARPQNTAVTHCAAVKLPCSKPACEAMVEAGRAGLKDLSW